MGQWNSFRKKRTVCPLKRVIVIAAEGEVTEPEYFQHLNSMSKTAHFDVVANFGNGSSPRAVLARMEAYLKDFSLGEDGEAWIVLDRDKWPDEAIESIRKWTQKNKEGKYHFAVSERRFENWLKLHVEGDAAAQKEYHSMLCGQEKHILDGFVTKERVLHAMRKAKARYPTPRSVGNVFEILESFFRP